MKEKKRFFRALFSGEEGAKISDVKFFLGDERNITQEEIYREAGKALIQEQLGTAEVLSGPDKEEVERVHIERFLST